MRELISRLPKRESLVGQTVRILRQSLTNGAWRETMPSERELCEWLRISRVTLRAALDQLQREGLIEAGRGRRRRVVFRPSKRRRSIAGTQVVLLSPVPLHELRPAAIFWVDILREDLAKAGYELVFQARPSVYGQQPEQELAKLLQTAPVAGWVLYHSTHAMQEWFAERGMPCVLAGSPHGDIRLASVDVDYRALCRHAVGKLASHGHQHLAFLLRREPLAGDHESALGFREGLQATSGRQLVGRLAHHDGTVGGLCLTLRRLLRSQPRPTGFLVANPEDALTVHGALLHAGLRFPDQVGLIARDDDRFLASVVPSMARYTVDPVGYARKISRVVLTLLDSGVIRPRNYRILPEFVSGGTLSPDTP